MPKRNRDHMDTITPTKTKRRKIETIKLPQRFRHQKDQQCFEDLFNVIDSTLKLSSAIHIEIAFLATGTIQSCYNEKCPNKVIVLNEDEENGFKSDNNFYQFVSEDHFDYSWKPNDCFCSECMLHTEQCGCGEWKFVTHNKECVYCETVMAISDYGECFDEGCEDVKYHYYACEECDKIMCIDCRIRCDQCGASVCHDCWDCEQTGKYHGYKCVCGNAMGRDHLSCDSEPYGGGFTRCYGKDCHETVCFYCDMNCWEYNCKECGREETAYYCNNCRKNIDTSAKNESICVPCSRKDVVVGSNWNNDSLDIADDTESESDDESNNDMDLEDVNME